MKFIKFDGAIFETTTMCLEKRGDLAILLTNQNGEYKTRYETREKRDAEFDRLEKLLIGEK